MKKIAVLALVCILLIVSLSGCTSSVEPAFIPEKTANFLPDITAFPDATYVPTNNPATSEPTLPPVVDELLAPPADATVTPNAEAVAESEQTTATPEPTAEITATPEPTPEATATPAPTPTPVPTAASPYLSYNYSALNDTAFGFVMNYPSTWNNLPGKYTACFREPVSDEDFAARVAVSRKKMPHKPDAETIYKQFQAFAKEVYQEYDPSTFEFGELSMNGSFMGTRAMEISYLAYSGKTEVKGYMCCCAIDYTIYVFHFCSSYDKFEEMRPVMTRIRDSVTRVK